MSAIDQLKEMFLAGSISNDDAILTFEGLLGKYQIGLDELENDLGYKIPSEIVEFLFVFGGTKLFVDSYKLGVEIFPITSITERNHELQKSTEQYWPMFAIFGFDHFDNMLCFCKIDEKVHFGILDHEAWAVPDVWANDAMAFSPFKSWLQMFVEKNGETFPSKGIRYEI